MPSPINLADVTISLRQFSDISSGKYNVGEAKPTGEDSIGKNEETGAVVVNISKPEGFPFHFHRTSTIALDGTVTSTSMIIESEA